MSNCVKYTITVGSVQGEDLNGNLIVNSEYCELYKEDLESYTIRYKILNFDIFITSNHFLGDTGYLEKNMGSGRTLFSFTSWNGKNFSGDAEVDVIEFTDNFKVLPDCMTLFMRLSGQDREIPGLGCLDVDGLGQYKIQFTMSEMIEQTVPQSS